MASDLTRQLKSSDSLKRTAVSRTIDSFFSKKPKSTNDNKEESFVQVPVSSAENRNMLKEQQIENNTDSACKTPSEFASDIGHYVGQSEIDDITKANLLESHWTPPADYSFPYCIVNKKGKPTKKYAQRSHLDKFHWLVLSHKNQGLYCKFCVLFGKDCQRNTHSLGRLVKEPLKAFDDLLGEKGALLVHSRNQYHKHAVELGKNFLLTHHKPALEIVNQVSKQRLAQIEENRQRLKPIVSTIILCGRQNLALRGHRDYGPLIENTDEAKKSIVESNDGNFRALLRFRIEAGDKTLEAHLNSAKSNATYIGNLTQNQLINACKDEIQAIILDRVKEAQLFSVIFDETTDLSHTSQLSLCLRYFYRGSIREDFITFCDAYSSIKDEDIDGEERRLTGRAIAHIVEDLMTKFNVDMRYCVGIGVDSCSTMASDVKGAASELKKKAIHAKRCPCTNHVLNNSLARSSKVTSCRNATATMKKFISFSNASAKRQAVFKAELKGSLQSLSETRWVERHDGHLQFQGDSLVKICNALLKISDWNDSNTASEARCLYETLRSSEFLVATISLCDVLGTTVSLSRFLQSPMIDLKKATGYVQDTLAVLEDKRINAECIFNQLFLEIIEIASQLDTEIKMPRLASRQTQRANIPSKSPEEYFRKTIYIPLLDNVISDLKDRLSPDVMSLFNLNVFLPKPSYSDSDMTIVREVAQIYIDLLKVPVASVVSEFQLWITKWKRQARESPEKYLPDSLIDILEECDKDVYPSINCLLRLLATLPVSIATSERSFSTVRRVKSWLRASMGEERLVGLALLNIHKDINVDVDAVINRFAKCSKRRLEFVL